MSRYAHIKRPCPVGMASGMELAAVAPNEARLIRGFLPGRQGALYSSHLMRWTNGDAVPLYPVGMFWYLDPRVPPTAEQVQGVRTSNRLVTVGAAFIQLWAVRWQGAHDVPSLAPVLQMPMPGNPLTDWDYGSYMGRDPWLHLVSVQIGNEVFFCFHPGSRIWRLFTDDTGTAHVYRCGIESPDTDEWTVAQGPWTAPEVDATEGLTPDVEYSYRLCWADEKQRLSSPSETAAITLINPTRTPVVVEAEVQVTWPEDEQVRYAVLYRAAQGTTNYYAITPSGADSIYIPRTNADVGAIAHDRTIEANLVLGALCPQPGENDRPPYAACLAYHDGRLWCDDRSYGSLVDNVGQYEDAASTRRIRCSNLNAPTQWNSVADTEEPALGVSLEIGSDVGDRVQALASLGGTLGIWRDMSFEYLMGSSVADWKLEHGADVGCVHPRALSMVRGMPYWLAEDGLYSFSSPYVPVCVSRRVDNYFSGAQKGLAGSVEGGW